MSAILDNVLIPLPSLTLPRDYAWRVRFIPAVDEQLRRLRSTGHFNPPRFYGYYFQKKYPVGVSGNWVVSLEAEPVAFALFAFEPMRTHAASWITVIHTAHLRSDIRDTAGEAASMNRHGRS